MMSKHIILALGFCTALSVGAPTPRATANLEERDSLTVVIVEADEKVAPAGWDLSDFLDIASKKHSAPAGWGYENWPGLALEKHPESAGQSHEHTALNEHSAPAGWGYENWPGLALEKHPAPAGWSRKSYLLEPPEKDPAPAGWFFDWLSLTQKKYPANTREAEKQ